MCMSSRERRVGEEEEEEEAMVAAFPLSPLLFLSLSFLSVSQCRRYKKAQNRDQNKGESKMGGMRAHEGVIERDGGRGCNVYRTASLLFRISIKPTLTDSTL